MNSPMLATLKKEVPVGKGWLFEKKFDGIRCIVVKKKDKVTLYSRNNKIMNKTYPEIAKAFASQKKDFVIDGEIVAEEKGISSFEILQKRMNVKSPSEREKKIKVYFFAFDILSLEGKDCKSLSLLERKKLLKQAVKFSKIIRYTSHSMKEGKKALQTAEKKGWEGVIGKRIDSKYISRRSTDWIKLKCTKDQEFIIIGYTDPQGARKGFGALLIGYYEKSKLKYAGKVGTGYDEALLQSLSKKLKKIEVKKCPVDEPISERHAHWVKPKIVGQVGFTEWTKEGKLRHPAFLGVRMDKAARNVVRERAK